ncbi:MAG: HEPN domain-containing protein [Rikenellaceae bacterium]|nr:HEPN domain-containing protein [uncultured Alistipes sp.]MDO5384002.1 HEPN domain-containing protein [Rikenellaceae bacterium]
MKNSIDFLPERKQRDLRELVRLIRDEVKDVVMVILYGSYARNTYVECDERRDFGVRTFYISDYDLLIVTKKRLGVRESTAAARIGNRFLEGKNAEFHTHPQFINESISKLNNALSEGRYFYVDILAQGIMLYDSEEYQLATPCDLDYPKIKKMAQEYLNNKFSRANSFLFDVPNTLKRKDYKQASFYLHQATENFLKSIPLVYVLYGYKEHDLEFLIEKCKPYTLELAKVFPRDTPEEERLFKLLQRAYVEARYNDDFAVSKDDTDALTVRVERLRDITEKVCRDRIAFYDSASRK